MASEVKNAGSVTASVGLTNPDNMTGVADANWATADDNNTNGSATLAMDDPTGNPTTGADVQSCTVTVRQFDEGQTGNPDCDIQIWETGGGAAIAASGDVSITNGSQDVSVTWDAVDLTTADGTDVEIRLVLTKSGGSPGSRNTIDVESVKWDVEYDVGATIFNKTLTDEFAVADPTDAERERYREALDAFASEDSLAAEFRRPIWLETLADFAVMDQLPTRRRIVATVLEALGDVTDTAIAQYINIVINMRQLSDDAVVTDNLQKTLTFIRDKQLSDDFTVTDQLIALIEYIYSKQLLDVATANDTLVEYREFHRALLDTFTVIDVAVPTYVPGAGATINSRTLQDNFAAVDLILRGLFRIHSDDLAVTDALNRFLSFGRVLSGDILSVVDVMRARREFNKRPSDSISIDDFLDAQRERDRQLAESVGAADSIIGQSTTLFLPEIFIKTSLGMLENALIGGTFDMTRKNFERVLINDTFKLTWVSSGITPGTISLKILDGDENTVAQPTVTASGNGHYFANTLVNSIGFYVSEWFADINGNDHRRRRKFKAITGDVD